jgi:glycosyltransferase involved in cell wall biosynthesis
MGHEVTLACLDYPHLGPQVAAPGVRVVSVKGNIFAVRGRGWCPECRRVLREEAVKADVVHNHGLWMWPNAYAREAAVAAGKPLIISPRGMLEAWSLGRSKLRKAVVWRLFERKNLQAAAMFHATAASEARSIEEVMNGVSVGRCFSEAVEGGGRKGRGEQKTETLVTETPPYRKPVVVAPNGVDLPDLARRPGREVLETRFPELKNRRWIVFMSRLHPKKGVDVLLHAWARQKEVAGTEALRDGPKSTEWRVKSSQTETPLYRNIEAPHRGAVLVLAGSDLIGYRKDIERMIKELGLEDSVVITGEVSGEAKDCLLGNAEVFVLPSYSENFGIVVAEAMAWGCPVIASTGTPWKELADVGAGWWVEPEEDALAKALAEALGTRQEELEAMGAKGRALVEQRYGWAAPARSLVEAYSELIW